VLWLAGLPQAGGHLREARLFFLVGSLAARVRQETLQSGALDGQIFVYRCRAHLMEERNGAAAAQPEEWFEGGAVPPERSGRVGGWGLWVGRRASHRGEAGILREKGRSEKIIFHGSGTAQKCEMGNFSRLACGPSRRDWLARRENFSRPSGVLQSF
jgi:hypothetical protein